MISRRRKIIRLFAARRGRLDDRVKRDYLRNGIATIPCRIAEYGDVISRYSVKGFETLNPEFVDYLKTTAELTPPESPLVLDIIGGGLTQEEKETIEYITRDDLAYDLGMVEREEKRHKRVFIGMFIGFLIFGLLLWFTESLAEVPRELIFILFWFMGETLCDYIFLTGYELRRERRLAGRLASIKVIFSDRYEKPEYTKKDVEKLYSEIENDVKKTFP